MSKSVRTTGREVTRPLPLESVDFGSGFWSRPRAINRAHTIPHQYRMCERTGRIDAFRLQWKPGAPHQPHQYWDSDVGKWIEAAAYSLATHPDPELERCVGEVIDLIAGAQQPDGYLNTYFTQVEPGKRWTNLLDMHELYCAGHLIEGAVAWFEATGKRRFLDVMCRYADCIGRTFGRARGRKRGYDGHEEIELALVKLHSVTGEARYLELARYFVDERGRQPHYFDAETVARGANPRWPGFNNYTYVQAHAPVREQREVIGHAVRAMYLYCGMTDVAAATSDRELFTACRRLWKHLVETRLHITGGIGATHLNEGFTHDYDLPNESAYLETCAAIGLVFWAHRMLAAELDGQYADVMERALYNGVLSGMSLDGKAFFYGNPLAAVPGFDGNGYFVGEWRRNDTARPAPGVFANDTFHYRRREWFGCACCPPNLSRLLASLGRYMYAATPDSLCVHLYAASRAALQLNGTAVTVSQQTDYPWSGEVRLEVAPRQPVWFGLKLRIPGWCRRHALQLNGERLSVPVKKGYVCVRREWRAGDVVALTLDMPVERMAAHPRVRQDAGRIALQRGPLVYCLEECDNPHVMAMTLSEDAEIRVRHRPRLLGGIVVLEGTAYRVDEADWRGHLYAHVERRKLRPAPFRAIPYYAWANRKPGAMTVWVPQVLRNPEKVKERRRRKG